MDLGSTGSRLFVYCWQPQSPLRSITMLGNEDTHQRGASVYFPSTGGQKVLAKEVLHTPPQPSTTLHDPPQPSATPTDSS